jgi:hypothetical protein
LALIGGRFSHIFEVDIFKERCPKCKYEMEAAVMAPSKRVNTMHRKAKQSKIATFCTFFSVLSPCVLCCFIY